MPDHFIMFVGKRVLNIYNILYSVVVNNTDILLIVEQWNTNI